MNQVANPQSPDPRRVAGGRVIQVCLVATTLMASWLLMMVVHELGHVLSAWFTGGSVEQVVLPPLGISRTDVAPNPRPHLVVWGGPLFGVGLPLLLWKLIECARFPVAYLFRFFAGLCCVANGAYIGAAIVFPVGDAEVMLQEGSPRWLLALFGAASCCVGLLLWQGQGGNFGLGRNPREVSGRHAVMMAGLLAAVIAIALRWF